MVTFPIIFPTQEPPFSKCTCLDVVHRGVPNGSSKQQIWHRSTKRTWWLESLLQCAEICVDNKYLNCYEITWLLVTFPSLIGTLKSTRMRTRLSLSGTLSMDNFCKLILPANKSRWVRKITALKSKSVTTEKRKIKVRAHGSSNR